MSHMELLPLRPFTWVFITVFVLVWLSLVGIRLKHWITSKKR
jgi:hypothetical protein